MSYLIIAYLGHFLRQPSLRLHIWSFLRNMRFSLASRELSPRLTDRPRVLQETEGVSDKHIDLWEHASTLYHSYEWQDAAHLFHRLAELLGPSRESMLCLLNVSLIRARMGDFVQAVCSLHAAARIDPHVPLTVFILGLLEWEIGNTGNAEACFYQCLDMLGADCIDYHPLNMRYILKPYNVMHNLRAVRFERSQARETQVPTNMSAISARLLFEAPSRINVPLFSPYHRFESLSLVPEPLTIRPKPIRNVEKSTASLKTVFGFRNYLRTIRPSRLNADTDRATPRSLYGPVPEMSPSSAGMESSFASRISRRSEAAKLFFHSGREDDGTPR
nr:hypothetical protein CFP56_65198 [Quercus suber]